MRYHFLNSQFSTLNSQLSILLSGWIYNAKKNIEGCNNNLEKTLSEKTEKYNMHQ